MRKINKIIIHQADTPKSMDIGVEEIRKWHVEGNGWKDIGYHLVIRRNGLVEQGRPFEIAGAHAKGHNFDSIGICLVGGKPEFNFTREQLRSLSVHVDNLCARFKVAEVGGHRDYGSTLCPGFDVKAWYNL